MNEDDDRNRVVTNRKVGAGGDEHATLYSGNSLPPGFVVADFQIESVIGKGGFSIVYRARDRQLRRRNALKEYMPASMATRRPDFAITVRSDRLRDTFEAGLRSFVNEAQVLARFDHPALVKVWRFWEERGTAYMAMPYYEGKTLKQFLHSDQTTPSEEWLRSIFEPLLDAIELLHGQDYLHRDVAPDNIMILRSGAPLLLDFGAARHVIGDMTQAPTAILKPGYAPIEQYAETSSTRQGPWTDVYAIAAVLYVAVTGRVPPPSVARLIGDELRPVAAAAPKGFSDRFLAAIQAGLAIKPEDRPSSIADFRSLLGYGSRPSVPPEVAVSTSEAPTLPPKQPGPAPILPPKQPSPAPIARDQAATPGRKPPLPVPPEPAEAIAAVARPTTSWRYWGLGVVLAGAIVGTWFAVRPDATHRQTGNAAPAERPSEPVGASRLPAHPPVETPATPAPRTNPPIVETPVAPQPAPSQVPPKAKVPSETVAAKSPPDRSKQPAAGGVAAERRGSDATRQACAQLLQEFSIGLDTPELRAKLETLSCPRPR